jgi:predicted Rossmann-fold nucleotide-binding protein
LLSTDKLVEAVCLDEGWILLIGYRNTGIMEVSAKGARDRDGITDLMNNDE